MNPNYLIHTRQLQYFVSVAELLSFTKAAEANHIAQTAMSQNIISLEKQLEVQLFERNKRNVALTNAGMQFYEDAKRILKELELSIMRTQKINEGFEGTLHIGFQGIHEKGILPNFIRTFKRQFPNIDIILKQDSLSNLSEKLNQNMLDVIFSIASEKVTDPCIEERIVSQESICAVMPKDHPLAGQTKVSRQDFKDEAFIFMKPEDSSGTFETMMEDCRKSNYTPNIVTYTSNVESVLMLIEAGMGISFLPKCCGAFNENVAMVELAEENTSNLVLRWKNDNHNPTVPLFLDVVVSLSSET